MNRTRTTNPLLLTGLVMLLFTLLAGCGGPSRQVRGEAPLVDLDGVGLLEERLMLDLALRNVNDTRLEIAALTLFLDFDGERVAELRDSPRSLGIAPRGREVLRIEVPASPESTELLRQLADGERTSLPWQLELNLESGRRQSPTPIARGFLHAVPGQPNRFR